MIKQQNLTGSYLYNTKSYGVNTTLSGSYTIPHYLFYKYVILSELEKEIKSNLKSVSYE